MAKSPMHACSKCGAMHCSRGDTCGKCLRAALVASRARACAYCGSPVGDGKRGIAPYCSAPCASQVKALASAAVAKVHAAIRAGSIARLDGSVPCVDCGAPAAQYEHRDYSKPLAVDPVCRSCNIKRGPVEFFTADRGRFLRDGSRVVRDVA